MTNDYTGRMRKLQGLLAKAEGTDNEHEAEAFMAKAHALMIDMAIDEAQVREAMSESDRAKTSRPVKVDMEYSASDSNAYGKRLLMNAIARATRCRMLNYDNSRGYAKRVFGATTTSAQWCAIVGYEGDVERVKILYASLLVQSFRFGAQDFKNSGTDPRRRSRWMTSYIAGFAATVGRRLEELNEKAQVSTNALIVRTEAEVDEAFGDFFPNTRQTRSRRTASTAYYAGAAGGARADIGRPSVGGARLQLGRG